MAARGSVVVVGGGIAGLAAAWELSAAWKVPPLARHASRCWKRANALAVHSHKHRLADAPSILAATVFSLAVPKRKCSPSSWA